MATRTISQAASAPARTKPRTAEDLVAELTGNIAPVRVSFTYKLGLLAVTVMMLLLPLIYIGIVALTAYLVYLHAIHNVGIIGTVRGRGAILTLFIYLAPIVIGALLVAFMIKPFFAARAYRTAPLILSRSEQRLFYTFVDKLCTIVGARKPSHISVDCDVNASASFRDGFFGLLTGRLVLTVGTPLMAGLTARQLTGVLAHEFGHFAQGTGMRLTFIVRSINAWFYRVVYVRDSWDESLVNAQHGDSHWMINLTAALVRAMVWLTRRVLWMLMWTGHFVSSFMLRQMEFDADRYEARVAGGDNFAETSERIQLLGVSMNAALSDLRRAWQERRLCDDLTILTLSNERQMPGDVRELLRKNSTSGKTGWFDSHPSDADRIASVRRENAPGIFLASDPAALLIDGFPELSRRATDLFYRENLGHHFNPAYVVSSETIVAQTGEQAKSRDALQRFGQGHLRAVKYPYEHADKSCTISRFILDAMPTKDEVSGTIAATETTLESVYGLYARLMSDIAQQAEDMEKSFGLDPLPEPASDTKT